MSANARRRPCKNDVLPERGHAVRLGALSLGPAGARFECPFQSAVTAGSNCSSQGSPPFLLRARWPAQPHRRGDAAGGYAAPPSAIQWAPFGISPVPWGGGVAGR